LARGAWPVKPFTNAHDSRLAAFLLYAGKKARHECVAMKNTLSLLAPLSMLALAACNQSETPMPDAEADAASAAQKAAAEPMPPPITSSGVYRCGDNTILHVDFFGANEAADIRVGEKTATAIRVIAPKPEAPVETAPPADGKAPAAAASPAGPMKSADGTTTLAGSGKQINVKLAEKGAQTCKSS
jgi:hypothetical protein